MAGAERERRFDLDADAVDRNASAVVRAMDDEAARGDGRESGEALAHPVGFLNAREAQPRGGRRSGGLCDRCAQGLPIDLRAEMDRHLPAAAACIEQAHRKIVGAIKLREDIGDPMRGLFIGFKLRDRSSMAGTRSGRR